jgi:hypothetical protein
MTVWFHHNIKRDTRQLVIIIRWDPETGERRYNYYHFQDQQFLCIYIATALVRVRRDIKKAIRA